MPLEIELDTDVKTLASRIRQAAFMGIGERQYAKLLLSFDRQVMLNSLLTSHGNPLAHVLNLLHTTTDPKTYQLALCWLNGKGFGWLNYFDLAAEFERLHAA